MVVVSLFCCSPVDIKTTMKEKTVENWKLICEKERKKRSKMDFFRLSFENT